MERTQLGREARLYGPELTPHRLSWPTIALTSIAALKVTAAMLLWTPLVAASHSASSMGAQVVLQGLPWLLPAAILLLANGRQVRTGSLGVAMVLVSTGGLQTSIRYVADVAPIVGVLNAFAPAVFVPYYFGRFVLEFPQPRTGPAARWLRFATIIAGVAGCLRFGASIAAYVLAHAQPTVMVQLLTGSSDARPGQIATYLLTVLILLFSLVGFNGLLPDDRRRHQRLLPWWGLLILMYTISLSSSIRMDASGFSPGVRYQPLRLLLGILAVTRWFAPSVIAFRALEGRRWQVREGLRRGVHLLLDSRWLATVAVVPLAAIAVLAYRRQDQPVSAVFSRTAIAWMIVAAASAALLFRRRRLLRAFNRRLFREHYNAAETLFELSQWMRQSRGVDELVAHLTSGIDRALRPYRVVVLVRDESATQFVPLFGSAEPLPASSLLADVLSAGRGVLDAPLAGGTSPMRWLPQEERFWLVDCGARLIAPLHGSDGSLNGLIAIGDRKSGRPYTDDDRAWLTALAEAATLTIEAHSASGAPGETGEADAWRVGLVQRHARALECEPCGHIHEVSATSCRQCGAALVPSLVPQLLFGKFRFEQRIGRGGMGVVFRATDLALERPVAIKMLPGATPEYSELLRLEARAMAAVTHRHLATVYGVEAWRGQALLVCEYMPHGTLADRLKRGAMTPDDVLTLGVALAEALDVIHTRQLLHRDIKPSNIGFDHTGVPKLLDFGLAHLLSTTNGLPAELRPDVPAAGTPLYLSPEAVDGAAPTRAFDLWSLHVLLYEAIAGRHPFRRDTTSATLRAITDDPAPPLAGITALSPDRAARITSYFAAALSKRAAERPRAAADVVTALRTLMA